LPVKRKQVSRSKRKSSAAAGDATGIPFEQVRALIDLLEERGLEEFEYERAGVRIRLKRRTVAPAPVFESYVPAANNPSAASTASVPAPPVPGEAALEGAPGTEELHIINSPIVGTFYAAPRPDAPSFVKLGDAVEVGQVLCIVEAMKLMNEIESDVAGELVRIYVENGQPVEYGEHLFAIRPTRKR
jgi:acetyl-CoA carboxylase biotin carboxyl carrier protein